MSAPPDELARTARCIRRVTEFPIELLEYVNWLRQGAAERIEDDYLFEKAAVRFEPHSEDVLVADPTLRVESQGAGTLLVSARAQAALPLSGVSAARARDLLACFDGERTLAAIRVQHRSERKELELLVAQTFGKVLFAPLALQELERAVSGAEISRFPGSPYEVARPYWANMASVRGRLNALESALGDDERFVALLQELHVVALMGADLQTFYRPRSPISQRRAAPGQLMHTPPRWLDAAGEALFVSGPRVNASFIGGRAYHDLLYGSLGELAAAELRAHVDDAGVHWGTVLRGRAEGDAKSDAWFCPPRPLTAAHFAALRTALSGAHASARRGERARTIEQLAHFHQAFIRLHPFHCGNQCLAMSIVNGVLGSVAGSIPHLMLDHLALRLSPASYAHAFARAVDAYASPEPDAARRYLELAQKRARAFALLHEISTSDGMGEARQRVTAAGEAARLLLLRPLMAEPSTAGAA
jgi:hypothetical protein